MDAVFAFGTMLTRSKFGLVKVGADWKLNSEESNLTVTIPADKTLVHVDANEFAFGVDTSAIDANAAFEFANVGKQHHEMGLARIPADAIITDLIQQGADSPDDLPPGVEFVGGTDADPGDTTNIVFTEPLAPGRYIMVCFVPDETEGENGTPHALKGMYKEFTIK
jgi:plastocyanin